MRLAFAPSSEVGIVENWDVLGLRGTGSHDLVMEGVEVPESKTVSLLTDQPWAEGPLYVFPPFAALSLGVAAVSLGVAAGAIEAFKELAGSKTPAMATRALGRRSTVRAELARCEAALAAARALHFDQIDRCWAKAEELAERPLAERQEEDASGGFSGIERARLRMAFTHAAETSADVCTRLHRLAGGTSVREGEVLERAFRDSHTATQHVLVGPQIHESVGGVLLGEEPGFNEL
jgi:alkylation response protein AidB-like acyl-CoA dehydrogenase